VGMAEGGDGNDKKKGGNDKMDAKII